MSTKITFLHPDGFKGLNIERTKFTATCVGYYPITKKNGDGTYILVFACKSKKTGETFTQEVGWHSFPYGLKNHQKDRNISKVLLGKKLAENRQKRSLHNSD